MAQNGEKETDYTPEQLAAIVASIEEDMGDGLGIADPESLQSSANAADAGEEAPDTWVTTTPEDFLQQSEHDPGAALQSLMEEMRDADTEEDVLERARRLHSSFLSTFIEARESFAGVGVLEASVELPAWRRYIEARNELLFVSVRDLQARRPSRKDEAALWGVAYEKQLDELYDTFITNEQDAIGEVNERFDAVEGLLIDPFLLKTFGSRISESYQGRARSIFDAMREPTFRAFEGLYAEYEIVGAGKRKIDEFEEARLEQFTARFAGALGFTDTNEAEKSARYQKRRLELARKLADASAEGTWKSDVLKRFWSSDANLTNSITLYQLSPEKRDRLRQVGSVVRQVFGKAPLRVGLVLALFGGLVSDALRGSTDADPERPTLEDATPTPERANTEEPSASSELQRQAAPVLLGKVTAERGAIGALDSLTAEASRLPWLQNWIERATVGAGGSSAERAEALAEELGFLSYMPTFNEDKPYAAFSANLPAGSFLFADESGLYYMDGQGNERLLVHPTRGVTDDAYGMRETDRYTEN